MDDFNKHLINNLLEDIRTRTVYSFLFLPEGNCNTISCKYLPFEEIRLLSWGKPYDSFFNGGHCPNSITKIEETLLTSRGGHTFLTYQKTNPENELCHYGVGKMTIFKKEYTGGGFSFSHRQKITPQMVFAVETNRVKESPSLGKRRIILDTNPITGERKLEGFVLLIAREFVENPDSKSLHSRLNKEFIPYLIENGVNVIYTSEESIMENAYKSDSLVFKSPFERQKFFDEMVEEVIESELDLETVDLDF